MIKVFLVPIFSMMLLACNSSTVKQGEKEYNTQVIFPVWVNTPINAEYVGVTGVAVKQDFGGIDAQRRVALTLARAELGRMKSLHINSIMNVSHSKSRNSVNQSAESETTTSSSSALDLSAAFVKDEWVNTTTEELYIWLVLKRK